MNLATTHNLSEKPKIDKTLFVAPIGGVVLFLFIAAVVYCTCRTFNRCPSEPPQLPPPQLPPPQLSPPQLPPPQFPPRQIHQLQVLGFPSSQESLSTVLGAAHSRSTISSTSSFARRSETEV